MKSFKIGKIAGISINIHFSLLFILLLLMYIFYASPPPFGYSNLGYIGAVYAVITSVLIFVVVLIHELCHSLVAKKFGAKVRGIILFIFGGIALIEDLPKEPKKEFLIAIAGPMSNFVIAFICYLLMPLSPQFFYILAYFNVFLAVFNLLPAFPMDGGRILRSLLARKKGYIRATKIAAEVGKFLAILMGIIGILAVNLWLILIALFIYVGASEEEKLVTLEGLLSSIKVKDIMTPNPIYVTPDTKVKDVIALMLRYKHLGYPVIENDKLVGIVTLEDVANADENIEVKSVMTKELVTISPNSSAFDALKLMSERGIGRVLVTENDRLVGIVSRSDIIKVAEILEVFKLKAES
ncbi:MAG TPA: CBS domain-containing protein [Archaeoglobus profundus]|nr:CBS domain-containing protein [Archaeoglobus profundus]HIP58076.1 CBS domain-containing protein [Archaeoglobus profundus]